MAATFQQLGVKPKSKTPEELKQWMSAYVHATESEEEKPLHKERLVVTQQQLRIPNFHGDSGKSEVDYELWRNEVDCLRNEGTYTEAQVLQAARKSLRGEAAGVAKRMGTSITIEGLLQTLDGVYGLVEVGETLMSQFYSAQQMETETVAAWSCRLEELLHKAKQKGQVSSGAVNEMLRTKFWTGLRQGLKDCSRHKFDTVKDFGQLRIEMRAIEHELRVSQDKDKSKQTKAQVKAAAVNQSSQDAAAELQELRGLVNSLQKELQSLKPNAEKQERQRQNTAQNAQSPPQQQQYQPQTQSHAQASQQTQQQQGVQGTNSGQRQRQTGSQQGRYPRGPRRCFLCGDPQHIMKDCPGLQQMQHLNMMGPPHTGGSWPAPTRQPSTTQYQGPTQNTW